MAQYQSFPGAPGESHTVDKLKALRMPDLHGRSFLDVGCNEGFFCGFAHFQGASRSLGVDRSAPFIERARQRFPECEFLCQGWEKLPDKATLIARSRGEPSGWYPCPAPSASISGPTFFASSA